MSMVKSSIIVKVYRCSQYNGGAHNYLTFISIPAGINKNRSHVPTRNVIAC